MGNGAFQEPTDGELNALRGKINPSWVGNRNDCDTALCKSCNCNCDDTYGKCVKQRLREKQQAS